MSFKPSSLLHFKFENRSLPQQTDKHVWSDDVKDAQGNPWSLKLYPRGKSCAETPDSDDPRIALFLSLGNTAARGGRRGEPQGNTFRDVRATATFIVKDREGKEITGRTENHVYKSNRIPRDTWGILNWIENSKVVDMNENEGEIRIDVLVQIQPPSTCALSTSGQFVSKMLALYDGGVGSDVTFKVGDCLIPAHKAIVQAHSQVLRDGIGKGKGRKPILIEGISKDAFVAFLRCHYGGDVAASLSVAARKDIIVAADRFEAPHIKIAAEASLAEEGIMHDDNVCDWYEFSHYKTCPLLKEQAASYFILRGSALLDSACSEKLKESPQLVTELMREMCNQISGTGDTLGVAELRKQLNDRGLDIDGSKEILMSRLQSSKKRSREE